MIFNPRQQAQLFMQRTKIVTGILIVLSLILIARFFYLQIIQKELYTTLSKQNQITLLPIEPSRGLIYDRNGILLAENLPVFSLELNADHVSNLESILTEVQVIIHLTEAEKDQIKKHRKTRRRFEPLTIKQNLTEDEVSKFSVNQFKFPALSIQARLIRHYPGGSAFSHVLGYVGRINKKELSKVDTANYSATQFIGKVGIERFYEKILHGQVGFQEVEMDASGRIVRVLKSTPPIPGDSLYLTIDSPLQKAAMKTLGNNRGAVVAIDPRTGEVLALASNPTYEPNQFVTGVDPQTFKQLKTSKNQPLFNRAIRGQYPPASTVKPFLALEALEAGIITAESKVYDPGWYKLENSTHLFRDWNLGGHGWISLTRAIIESCDTFFYDLSAKLGIDRIDHIMHRFGFGQSTGIDMKEELPGLIPNPDWKIANQGSRWYAGDTLITGIGQGSMLSTPLQLAHATAILANRGRQLRPHLLKAKQDPERVIKPEALVELPPVMIDSRHWDTILKAMEGVISKPSGTGKRFGRDASYKTAGKTGTAQLFTLKEGERYVDKNLPENLRDHSLFLSFSPYENPEIAVAVIIENSHGAPQVARHVTDQYLLKSKAQNAYL